MELIEGDSLDTQVFCSGRLPEVEARHIFRQLLLAVGYVHSRGILHRDIKLKNVLIAESTKRHIGMLHEVKLIDFGLCRQYPQAHTAVGTDLFVAPEVADR